jgi:Domain of unknown function (DUF4388)
MALSGNFETFNLNSIFQLLSDDQKTGVLKVRNEDKEIRIYIKDGEIIYATGSRKMDRLGAFLRNNDLVSKEQLEASLKKANAEKKALGKILIEQGILSSQKLRKIIHQQIEFLIFNLFLWDQGEFEYQDAALNLKGMIVAKINVVSLLLEASRRIDEISILRKHIPSDKVVYRITGKVSDKNEVTLNSVEIRVMGLVDGNRSLRQVIQEGGFDEYSAYRTVYSLLSSGLIESVDAKSEELAEESEKEPEKEPENYTTIIGVYNNVLQILFRDLEGEIGKQALAIFEQSKQVSASQPYEIFRNFQPENTIDTNTQEVSLEIAAIKNFQDACQVLIDSFNEFILNILARVNHLLGPKMAQHIIQNIETALPGGKTGRPGIVDREHVIGEIGRCLSQAREDMGSK